MEDIDYIVFYDKPVTKFDRILTGYMATPVRSYRAFLAAMPVWLRRKLWVDPIFHKELGYEGSTLFIPHHLSHAAGAFYTSPFDKAAILTVDGVGEWATAAYGIGDSEGVRLIAEMQYPHSVGLLYSAFTYYLAMRVNSSEYKVMGLAPYGKPKYAELITDKLVKIHEDGSIHLNMDYFTFHHGLSMTGPKFEKLFGQPRRSPDSELEPFHEDIAASIQAVTETILIKMARHVRRETGMDRLCLSGGVALNCKANHELCKEGIFSDIYVQPASGDAGGAVGAALYACHRLKLKGGKKQRQPFFTLGPEYTDDQVRAFLDSESIPYLADHSDRLATRLAAEIDNGNIVAVFQGAMEFGPRALGFRSILADPRNRFMKEKINAAVKYRESFRPFAPAVMVEHASEYFDCPGASPYMVFNYQVNPDKRSILPAVTHVDNSARIQTVSREDNSFFYKLIEEFKGVTGVPVLLNTSFNLRGHPIVNSPRDALATFCSGGIDFLLMGSFLIDKNQLSEALIDRYKLETGYD
jgi:carbamoyltransferase